MEKLKKKCVKTRIIVLVFMVVIGVLFMALTGFAAFRSFSVKKLTADSDFSQLEGEYVSYEMKAPIDYYETFTRRNSDTGVETITQYGYVVYDMEGGFFFGVVRDADQHNKTEAMIDQLWTYWFDEEGFAPASVTIKGTLTRMDPQDKIYFDDTLEVLETYYGMYGDAVYYYIEEGDFQDWDLTSAWIFTVIALGLIAFGVIFVLLGNRTWDKKIRKYLSKNTQYTMEMIKADAAAGKLMNKNKTIIGKRWIITVGASLKICELDNLCWGYYYRRTGRYAVSQMRLFSARGGNFNVDASEANAKEMLEYLYEQLPYVIVGYKSEWEKMYNKNREEFLALRFYPGKQQMGAQDASTADSNSWEQTGDALSEQ